LPGGFDIAILFWLLTLNTVLRVVFESIRALMAPPDRPRKKIGFLAKEPRAKYGRK